MSSGPSEWIILIDPAAMKSLEKLSYDSAIEILDYIQNFIPQHPNPPSLAQSKSGDLKGISSFSRNTPEGMMRIFAHIDHSEKKIKILHVCPRNQAYDKKHKKTLQKLLNKSKSS